MIQQNPERSRAPHAGPGVTTTTTPRATRLTSRKKRKRKKKNRRARATTLTRGRAATNEGRPLSVEGSAPSAPRTPEAQAASVGERVGVALALLAVVLAVLVARAVAALALARERTPARNRVVLVQVAAVPADPVVHFAHASFFFG